MNVSATPTVNTPWTAASLQRQPKIWNSMQITAQYNQDDMNRITHDSPLWDSSFIGGGIIGIELQSYSKQNIGNDVSSYFNSIVIIIQGVFLVATLAVVG